MSKRSVAHKGRAQATRQNLRKSCFFLHRVHERVVSFCIACEFEQPCYKRRCLTCHFIRKEGADDHYCAHHLSRTSVSRTSPTGVRPADATNSTWSLLAEASTRRKPNVSALTYSLQVSSYLEYAHKARCQGFCSFHPSELAQPVTGYAQIPRTGGWELTSRPCRAQCQPYLRPGARGNAGPAGSTRCHIRRRSSRRHGSGQPG